MPKRSNLSGADITRHHDIDLDAPGGIEALLEFHRARFGDARMEADDDTDSDDDSADGGDGNDDRFSGLLGDDEDDDTNIDDDTDSDDDEDDSASPLTAEAVAAIVESAIDRRLNTPKMRRSNAGGSARSRDNNTGGGVDQLDAREARQVYREHVADELKFIGSAEREHALAIANERIADALARGDDPTRAGRAAATEAARSVRSLRKLYEKRTVDALRSRGLLVESDNGATGRPNNTSRTQAGSSGSNWARGQSVAASMGRSKSAQSK